MLFRSFSAGSLSFDFADLRALEESVAADFVTRLLNEIFDCAEGAAVGPLRALRVLGGIV